MTIQTSSVDLMHGNMADLRNTWHDMPDTSRVALTGTVSSFLPPRVTERVEFQITACFEKGGGKISANGRFILGLPICPWMPKGERRIIASYALKYLSLRLER